MVQLLNILVFNSRPLKEHMINFLMSYVFGGNVWPWRVPQRSYCQGVKGALEKLRSWRSTSSISRRKLLALRQLDYLQDISC